MQNSVLVGIMTTLMIREKTTVEELAKKYEISKRTVMRYVDAINESGVPIVTYRGRNGGYAIIDKYKLKSSFFTREEYDKIFDALKTLPPDKTTNSIIDKLSGLKQQNASEHLTESDKVIIDTSFSHAFKNKFHILQNAINDHLCVNIQYVDKFGEQTSRRIEPIVFLFKEGVWYIYSFCLTRNDFRFFKLNRIANIQLTNDIFEPRPYTLDPNEINKFLQKNKQIKLTLTFDNDALVEIQEWLGEDKVIKKGAGYMATAQLPYDEFLLTKLLTFGERIKIQSPLDLTTDIVNHLQKLLRFYSTQ
ncbi:MAG: YafY family transcriptional regulator [Clostridia bacterium]|nr:YafY family transcriptional regulator [Clostridia bacterium]